MLSVHSKAKARERDAELSRRDVAILSPAIAENMEHPRRPPTSMRRRFLEGGPRGADDRKFRGDKKGGQQDQTQRDEDRDHPSASSPSDVSASLTPFGWSSTHATDVGFIAMTFSV